MDIVIGLPFQWSKVEKGGKVEANVDGLSDISLECKWRFLEKDGLSFALKPGATLPSGNKDKGLGNGRPSYGIVFITTKERKPWAFHFNLRYTHNEYKLDEDRDTNRKDILHISVASEFEVIDDLRVIMNIGIETNPDKALITQHGLWHS